MAEVEKGWYLHFKGGVYKIIGTSRHSETLEKLATYYHYNREEKKVELWNRPPEMFTETIDREGEVQPRFVFLGKLIRHELTKEQRQDVAQINREIRTLLY